MRDAYANLDKVDPKRRANAERALFDQTVAHLRVNGQGVEDLLRSLRGRNATDPWLQNALHRRGAHVLRRVAGQRMLADESPRVRAAVVDALGQQSPNALQGYYATSVAAKAAIDRTAESDPDPSVRTLAKNTRIMFAMR